MKIVLFLLTSYLLIGCTTEDQIAKWIDENPEKVIESIRKYQLAQSQKNQPSGDLVVKNNKALFKAKADPVVGNINGKIEIAYFFDFRCGHCARQSQTFAELIKKNSDVKLIYKNLPVLGPESELAARSALAAHEQGKFKEFYNAIYERRETSLEALTKIASDLNLDVKKWKEALQSSTITTELNKTRELAEKLKISGTPAIAIAPDKIMPGRVDHIEEVIKKL